MSRLPTPAYSTDATNDRYSAQVTVQSALVYNSCWPASSNSVLSSRRESRESRTPFNRLSYPPADNVQYVLAELAVIFGLLEQETIDVRHIGIKLVLPLRDVESHLCTTDSKGKSSVINLFDLVALAVP